MRLQQQFQTAIRTANYALSTERSYWNWIKDFIKFHKMRHPQNLTGDDISKFLSHLVMKKHVSVSTQQQALSALVFLYKKVLGRENVTISDWLRASRKSYRSFSLRRRLIECFLTSTERHYLLHN